MGIETLEIRLSGGASNTDPLAAYGGAMSTVSGGLVYSQTVLPTTGIAGVTLLYAGGNTSGGTGVLSYNHVSRTLTWTAPGATEAGAEVYVNATGTYTVRGSGTNAGYVVVSVVGFGSPSGISGTTSATLNVVPTTVAQRIFDDVGKDESYAGQTDYRFVYIKNTSASAARNVSVTLVTDTPAVDTLSVAKGNSAVNVTESAPADRFTAPSPALTWNGTNSAVALGDIPAGQFWGFWVRRVVPVSTVTGYSDNAFKIKLTALV